MIWRVPVLLYVQGVSDTDVRWEIETLLDAAFPADSGAAWTVDWADVSVTPAPRQEEVAR